MSRSRAAAPSCPIFLMSSKPVISTLLRIPSRSAPPLYAALHKKCQAIVHSTKTAYRGFYAIVTAQPLAFRGAAAEPRRRVKRRRRDAASVVRAMWGIALSQLESGLQASVVPSSGPLQLVLGLLLTTALVAARG